MTGLSENPSIDDETLCQRALHRYRLENFGASFPLEARVVHAGGGRFVVLWSPSDGRLLGAYLATLSGELAAASLAETTVVKSKLGWETTLQE
jgi:hypothetical protein